MPTTLANRCPEEANSSEQAEQSHGAHKGVDQEHHQPSVVVMLFMQWKCSGKKLDCLPQVLPVIRLQHN